MEPDEKEVVWIDHRAISQYISSNEPMKDFYLDELSTRDTTRTLQTSGEKRNTKQNWEYIAFEDVQKATQYWEMWGKQAAQGLLEKYQPDVIQKKLVYSGKCGAPLKFRCPSNDGTDSTNISLLSASDLEPQINLLRRGKRRKKKKGLEPKTDWEQYAKERSGVLAQLMQQDASRMDGYNTEPVRKDAMTRDERILLVKCGQGKGNLSRNRSNSTPQVFISPPKNNQYETNLSTVKELCSKNSSDNKSLCSPGKDEKTLSNEKSKRILSPKKIVRQFRSSNKRPSSLPLRQVEPLQYSSPTSPSKHFLPSPFSREMVPSRESTFTAHQSRNDELREMLGGNVAITQKARQKIQKTFKALDERTGEGDPNTVIEQIPEEKKIFTAADYGRVHRYPQNIRIAPQLNKVIKEDITGRMGRPKRHEIKIHDVRQFNKDNPDLGRSHRNLLIFNWLNAINEDDFDSKSEPDIFDIEGDDLGHMGTRLGTGMMGQNVTSSKSMSDGMSPRVSDDERWDESREWASDVIIIPPLDDD